jgi:hypothetical protein
MNSSVTMLVLGGSLQYILRTYISTYSTYVYKRTQTQTHTVNFSDLML